jgi:hypothetical protein
MNIQIRSVSTKDVKIAQRALETIGFKTVKEGDAVDAYWAEMSVPEKFAHGKCNVTLLYGVKENEDVTIRW